MKLLLGMPHIRPMPSISAVAGKSLTLKCPAAGYPIDNIVWEKGEIIKRASSCLTII